MWRETDQDGEWWEPEGTRQLSDPPMPLRADEYEDDQREWESRVEALTPELEGFSYAD